RDRARLVGRPPHRCLEGWPSPPRRREPAGHAGLRGRAVEDDPEKHALGRRPDGREPVFPRDKRGTRLRGDHAQTGRQMTWSIIARDSLTGQIGIAVATKFFAVGALVPHIAPGIGAVATQALVNPYYGIDGIKLLREGMSPNDIVKTLIAADSGRDRRQLHLMDLSG